MASRSARGQISALSMRALSGPLPARATWAVLPLLVGGSLGEALGEHSLAVARTASVLAWGGWAGVLVAVLVPRTVSLTVLRVVAPAGLVAANWAALTGPRDGLDALAVTGAALATVVALSPTTGDAFVNGSSYGDERRLPLRVPGPVLLGPLPLTWAAAVTGPVAGPLLLAARQWAAGALVLVGGGVVSFLAVRALHGLARRWVVLVPAGLVLHDQHALVEAVLFPRRSLRRLGPAPASPDPAALDATQGSFGLALELELAEFLAVSPRRRDGVVEVVEVDRVLFTPTRPGAVLREAAVRGIPVA